MKSKEEILIEKPCFEYSTMENRYYEWSDILDAMEEYAQQQVKNLNIPAVSNNEVAVCSPCDDIKCTSRYSLFCKTKCEDRIKQTDC